MKAKVIQETKSSDANFDLIIYYQNIEKFCLPGMDDKQASERENKRTENLNHDNQFSWEKGPCVYEK